MPTRQPLVRPRGDTRMGTDQVAAPLTPTLAQQHGWEEGWDRRAAAGFRSLLGDQVPAFQSHRWDREQALPRPRLTVGQTPGDQRDRKPRPLTRPLGTRQPSGVAPRATPSSTGARWGSPQDRRGNPRQAALSACPVAHESWHPGQAGSTRLSPGQDGRSLALGTPCTSNWSPTPDQKPDPHPQEPSVLHQPARVALSRWHLSSQGGPQRSSQDTRGRGPSCGRVASVALGPASTPERTGR